MIYGAEIKRWCNASCSNYFYTYMPTVHGKKGLIYKAVKLDFISADFAET